MLPYRLIPICALSVSSLVCAQSIQIDSTRFSSGRLVVTATSDADLVLVLQRFDGDNLTGSSTSRVGLALGQPGIFQELTEFTASGQPKGFFRIIGADWSTFEDDSDDDGIKDITELQAGDFLHPLNMSDAVVADVFDLVLDASVSDGVPALGAGNIETSNHADIYRFVGVAGTGVFVDAVSWSSELTLHDYQIIDPYGNTLETARFGLSDLGAVSLSHDGEYLLLVGDSNSDGVGTYAINLTLIPEPQSFFITIGDIIAPDDPQPGAGAIEAPQAFDSYFFSASAGDQVFLNTLSYSGVNSVNYRILDPTNVELGTQQFNLGDMGTVELPFDGIYTIEVGEIGNDDTGTYSIGLTAVPDPDSFSIAIGDTISDGVPGVGAGNIEVPGAFDTYTFVGVAGDKIFLDTQSFTGVNSTDYRLFDPLGNQLEQQQFNLGDIGTIELPETGTYTIEVGESDSDAIGTYSLAVTLVPPADSFVISIGDAVSDGVPGVGAGNIEVPGAFDVYTFAGVAGEKVFLDTLSFTGVNWTNYRLFDPSGSQLARQQFNLGDMGTIELLETGTYTIEVGESDSDAIGTYSLAVTLVPPPDSFPITIGDTVSDGAPGVGAGNIEVPGAFDTYTFAGVAGEKVFLDTLSFTGVNWMSYRLFDPSGNQLDRQQFNLGDMGTVELPDTGTYTIEVGDSESDAIGTYSLALTLVPPSDSFVIAIGDTVSDGVPGVGAGNIEVPGASDAYTFAGVAGDKVFLETLSFTGVNWMNYRLFDPSGNQLDRQQFNLGNMGTIELPETGTYTLEVGESDIDDLGTYSIRITAIPAPDTFAITTNHNPAGSIEVPGAFDIYTFSATAGEQINITNGDFVGLATVRYRLYAPDGSLLGNRRFDGSDLGVVILPETGTYSLEIGELTDASTGTYLLSINPYFP
ncbi:MAG: hypothetical protein ACSHYA_08570 [Opitutaceae bacterium]